MRTPPTIALSLSSHSVRASSRAGWGALAACLAVVSGACSPAVDDLHLPVSTQSELAQPTDFALTLRHVPPAGVECTRRSCSVAKHWVADTRSENATSPLVGRMRLDWNDWWPLAEAMRAKALGKQPAASADGAAATLSVRAAPETPMRVVATLLTLVRHYSDLYRVEFAVDDPGIPSPRRLPVSLDPGPGIPWRSGPIGVRVRIAEHRAADNEYFVMDWNERVPSNGGPWPPEPGEPADAESPVTGLDALAAHLREWRAAQEKQNGNAIRDGVITLSEVPFQDAVEVFDALIAAGFDRVCFEQVYFGKR